MPLEELKATSNQISSVPADLHNLPWHNGKIDFSGNVVQIDNPNAFRTKLQAQFQAEQTQHVKDEKAHVHEKEQAAIQRSEEKKAESRTRRANSRTETKKRKTSRDKNSSGDDDGDENVE